MIICLVFCHEVFIKLKKFSIIYDENRKKKCSLSAWYPSLTWTICMVLVPSHLFLWYAFTENDSLWWYDFLKWRMLIWPILFNYHYEYFMDWCIPLLNFHNILWWWVPLHTDQWFLDTELHTQESRYLQFWQCFTTYYKPKRDVTAYSQSISDM